MLIQKNIYSFDPSLPCVRPHPDISLHESRCLFYSSFNISYTFISNSADPVTSARSREDHYFQKEPAGLLFRLCQLCLFS